jgi:hypothetical protein
LILIVLGALFGTERTGRAQEEIPPRHAEVTFVAPSEDVQGLEIVLGELLARLEVSVRFMRVSTIDTRQILVEHPGDAPAVARAWIDLRDTSRVTLFLSGQHQDRLLIRQVPIPGKVDHVAREEIAHIVEATVDALLVGGRIGVVTEEGTGAKTAPTATFTRPRASRFDLAVGYEAQIWSTSDSPFHGPEMLVDFTMGTGVVKGGVLASAQFRLSQTVDKQPANLGPISTRLDQASFRALAVADASINRRWTVRGGFGGGIEWVRFSLQNPPTNVSTAGEQSAIVPMLRGLLAFRFAITPRSDVFFGLGADFDLFDTSFVVSGIPQPVFQPWRLRPIGLVGVGSDILAQ